MSESQAGLEALSGMLTIGDVARRYGLTLRALRFYEDRGLVQPLRHGTARFYDRDACRRIEVILRGKRLGYTLTVIAAMLARTGADADVDLAAEPTEVDAHICRLERKREDLDAAIADLRSMQHRLSALVPDGGARLRGASQSATTEPARPMRTLAGKVSIVYV